MKYFQLILLSFTCITNSPGQTVTNTYGRLVVEITKEKHPTRIYAKVEMRSAITASDSAWVRSIEEKLNRNIKIDRRVRKGKYIVIVKFIVSKDGSLSDVSCEKDPGYGTCAQVISAVKRSKNWAPARSYEVHPYRVTTQ